MCVLPGRCACVCCRAVQYRAGQGGGRAGPGPCPLAPACSCTQPSAPPTLYRAVRPPLPEQPGLRAGHMPLPGPHGVVRPRLPQRGLLHNGRQLRAGGCAAGCWACAGVAGGSPSRVLGWAGLGLGWAQCAVLGRQRSCVASRPAMLPHPTHVTCSRAHLMLASVWQRVPRGPHVPAHVEPTRHSLVLQASPVSPRQRPACRQGFARASNPGPCQQHLPQNCAQPPVPHLAQPRRRPPHPPPRPAAPSAHRRCAEVYRRCTPGVAACCPLPGAHTQPSCVPNGLLPPTNVCAVPPRPPTTAAVTPSSPDGTTVVVTVGRASNNGGTTAQLGYRCTIKSGATAYVLSAAAANPAAPTTDIAFTPGSTDDSESRSGHACRSRLVPGGRRRPCQACSPVACARMQARPLAERGLW